MARKPFIYKYFFMAELKPTTKLSIAIAVVVSVWMLSGLLFPNNHDDEIQHGDAFTVMSGEGETAKVRVRHLQAQPQNIELTMRGRTEAKRKVDIKAEMGGRVIETPVEKGQRIKEGDVMCRLAEDAHGAVLSQAKANYEKAKIDYEGALKLKAKSLLSETNIAASKAQLENAKASLKMAQVNYDHLSIRAPFDAFVEERPVEVGALMRHGETCASLIDESSVLAVGQVSERDVVALRSGQKVTAQLTGGGFIKGRINFVGRTAHPQTRTYRVEATLHTNGALVRDGSTIEVLIPLEEVMAYRITPAVLALDDEGQMGVRIVNAQSLVEFYPVTVVKESADGVWVTGLPPEIDLITVGQEYVADGDKVETVPDNFGTEDKQAIANKATDKPATLQ